MKYFLLCCLLGTGIIALAQAPTHMDSLDAVIASLPEGPERVDSLVLAGFLSRKNDMGAAARYANRAMEESRKIGYRKGEGNVYSLLGVLAYYKSNMDSAEWYQLKAIAIRKEIDDTLGLGKAYIDLGNVAADRGHLKKAIERYLTAQPYLEAVKDTKQLANLYVNIGSIYHEQENYDKTLEYYFEALKYSHKMQPNGIATVYNNISLVYKELGRYGEALDYSYKSLDIKQGINYERGIAASYTTIASIYAKQSEWDKAEEYYDLAIALYREIGDKYGLGMALGGKGDLLLATDRGSDAKSLYLEALPLAEEEGLNTLLRDVNLSLSELYASQGEYKLAYEARKRYEAANDSIVNFETNGRIAELMTEYETEQKEQALLLSQTEVARQQEVNRWQLIAFGGILLALLVLGGLILRGIRLKQKVELQEALAKAQKARFKAVIDAQEQERKRIAQDLHDGLGQLLSTARLNVSALEDSIDTADHETERIWVNALELIDESVQEVRNVSHNMMPSALIRLGLVAALREQVNKINQAGKLTVRLDIDGMEHRLDEAVEITLYRVVQEVLNNAIKHSKANEIIVNIARNKDQLEVSIKDDGQGLDLQLIKQSRGIGWKNIYSRVELINGVIDMNSSPGVGTNIQVLVPAA